MTWFLIFMIGVNLLYVFDVFVRPGLFARMIRALPTYPPTPWRFVYEPFLWRFVATEGVIERIGGGENTDTEQLRALYDVLVREGFRPIASKRRNCLKFFRHQSALKITRGDDGLWSCWIGCRPVDFSPSTFGISETGSSVFRCLREAYRQEHYTNDEFRPYLKEIGVFDDDHQS